MGERVAHGMPVWMLVCSGVLLAMVVALGLLVCAGMPALLALNEGVAAFVTSFRGGADGVVIFITSIGNPVPLALICIAFTVLLACLRQRRDAVIFAVAVLVAVVVAHILKLLFGVERPQAPTLVPLPASASYPSAHTTGSFAAFGMMGLIVQQLMSRSEKHRAVGIIVLTLFLLLAAAISVSRIYVGVHWTTDIIGGFLLALAVLIPARSLLQTGRSSTSASKGSGGSPGPSGRGASSPHDAS